MGKVLRASTSVDANFSSILHKKSYFFYFTYQFLQNTHISLSSLHIYLKKYSFFYNFLLFPPSPPLSLTNSSLPTTQPPSSPPSHHHHQGKPTQSIRNPFITHPTRNPLLIWSAWFDDRRGLHLMIWSAWFCDRHGSMISGNGWSAIDVVWWFISVSGLMIGNNGGMIWSNEERASDWNLETRREKKLLK